MSSLPFIDNPQLLRGITLLEQKVAVKNTSKVIADLIEAGFQVAITHSNAPQVGMIHTAMNEFGQRP